MPLILAGIAALGVGGLVFKTVADETEQVATRAGPQIALVMALALAGFVVFQTLKGKAK